MTAPPVLDSPFDAIAPPDAIVDATWDADDECPNCSAPLPGGLVVQDLLGTVPLACVECGAVLSG